jgi:thiosulfate dehydrogenase [quinone] large subunit
LPLRLFLAVSFLAAGWDKLTDPQFFDSSAPGYIGAQLAGFAGQSPLGGFLTSVAVPNATIFGALVLAGELAIGLGALVGLFSRKAAFFGVLLSLTLWLTASWNVTPFFLGSDLPYALGWLTLLIAGAHPVLSLDGQIQKWRERQAVINEATTGETGFNPQEQAEVARRRFITVAGATVLAGAVTGVAWFKSLEDRNVSSGTATGSGTGAIGQANATSTAPATTSAPATAPTNAPSTAASNSTTAAAPATTAANSPTTAPAKPTTAPTTQVAAPAPKGVVLTPLSAIPVGSAKTFTTPGTGEPAIVIHEADGSVKAFSAICTHEGCEVGYNKSSQVLVCPCHGAQFDAKTGQVLRRPARQPLKSFQVQVDNSGNIIFVQG